MNATLNRLRLRVLWTYIDLYNLKKVGFKNTVSRRRKRATYLAAKL